MSTDERLQRILADVVASGNLPHHVTLYPEASIFLQRVQARWYPRRRVAFLRQRARERAVHRLRPQPIAPSHGLSLKDMV